MSNDNNGVVFIHWLRALAPLFVLWAHLVGWWLAGYGQIWTPMDWSRRYIFEPLRLFQDGGYMGVILFFLISGYIISYTSVRETPWSFALKRIMRLAPTLFVATFAMWCIQTASPHLGISPPMGSTAGTVWEYLESLLLLPSKPYAISVTWSLLPEVLFYGAMILVIPLVKDHPLKSTVILLAIAIGASQMYRYIPTPPEMAPPLAYLPFFVVGRSLYLLKSGTVNPVWAIMLALASYTTFVYAVTLNIPGFIDMAWTSYAVATTIFLVALAIDPRWAPKPVLFLANVSYPLYLLHVPVGFFLLNWLQSRGFSFNISLPISVGSVLVVSWLCYKLVDRPVQRLARQLLSSQVRTQIA